MFSDAPYIVRGVSTYQDVCVCVCESVRITFREVWWETKRINVLNRGRLLHRFAIFLKLCLQFWPNESVGYVTVFNYLGQLFQESILSTSLIGSLSWNDLVPLLSAISGATYFNFYVEVRMDHPKNGHPCNKKFAWNPWKKNSMQRFF